MAIRTLRLMARLSVSVQGRHAPPPGKAAWWPRPTQLHKLLVKLCVRPTSADASALAVVAPDAGH